MLGLKSLLAVVVAVAVGGGGYLMTHSSSSGSSAAPQPVVTESALTLSVGGPAAKCARPVDPAHLKDADLVFEGTVTSLSEDQATVQVTHSFQGTPGARVRLQRKPGFSEAVSFVKGEKYLITASGGDVADCLSGPADDPSLRDSYQDAFPG